jgi:hypothetical protein
MRFRKDRRAGLFAERAVRERSAGGDRGQGSGPTAASALERPQRLWFTKGITRNERLLRAMLSTPT